MPDPKRLELKLRAHSNITRQQPEHKVRLLSQGFEYMRDPGHEAAGAMRLLEGQTEAGDIALVEHINRHYRLVQLMMDEGFAEDRYIGLTRHLDTSKPIRNPTQLCENVTHRVCAGCACTYQRRVNIKQHKFHGSPCPSACAVPVCAQPPSLIHRIVGSLSIERKRKVLQAYRQAR